MLKELARFIAGFPQPLDQGDYKEMSIQSFWRISFISYVGYKENFKTKYIFSPLKFVRMIFNWTQVDTNFEGYATKMQKRYMVSGIWY